MCEVYDMFTSIINQLHSLWDTVVQCRIHKDSSIISILSRIDPIFHIDACFFMVDSNIFLPSTPRDSKFLFPIDLLVNPASQILTTCAAQLKLLGSPDYVR